MSQEEDRVGRVFQALGDPTRRRILRMLAERPCSVKGLAEPLGISITGVSQQLRLLEEAGLVATEKVGRVRTCRIEPAGLDLARSWIEETRPQWSRRFDRLGALLGGDESESP